MPLCFQSIRRLVYIPCSINTQSCRQRFVHRWNAMGELRQAIPSSEFLIDYHKNQRLQSDIADFHTFSTTHNVRVVRRPTRYQLWIHFINAAVPMIGFGFIDNFIMLQAGEYLDTSIGVTFGISTLTAAAVGQIFSDVSGVAMGGMVQAIAGKHLPVSGLDPDQRVLGITRIITTAGRMLGVVCGCLLGMTSLLFMDLDESQRLKRFKELQPILCTIIRHTKRTINVKTCRLLLLGIDSDGHEVLFEVGGMNDGLLHQAKAFIPPSGTIRAFSHHFNRHPSDNLLAEHIFKTPLGENSPSIYLRCIHVGPSSTPSIGLDAVVPKSELIVKYVARTGEAVMCINNHRNQPSQQYSTTTFVAPSQELRRDGNNAHLTSSGIRADLFLTPTTPISNSVLCYPVFDNMDRDRVIGVIELTDKIVDSSNVDTSFTREDERLVRMLSEHLSLYLAMTNYHSSRTSSPEELESVEKINWVCPKEHEETT